MPTYVLLLNLTERGIERIRPDEAGEGQELAAFEDAIGAGIGQVDGSAGNLIHLYWTLGGYDIVAVASLSSDRTAAGLALWLAQEHGVRTTTMPAFSREEVTPGEDDDSVYDSLYRCHFGMSFRRTDR